MKLEYPSAEFDEVVGSVCHGTASDEQMSALNELLRLSANARDDYILRLELHARLASSPDLFVSVGDSAQSCSLNRLGELRQTPPQPATVRRAQRIKIVWTFALSACLAVLATGFWLLRRNNPGELKGTTTTAVAMLSRAVDASWGQGGITPRPNAPLEPGWLHLKSGLAQIVFYSGARVDLEGPADFQIVSPREAFCSTGRITAEVPTQARGFHVRTPAIDVVDLGTAFALEAGKDRTELHVFQGSVEFRAGGAAKQTLREGVGAVVDGSNAVRLIAANREAFASLLDLQARSVTADALRFDRWRTGNDELHQDPYLLVHYTFDAPAAGDWRLHNAVTRAMAVPDAAIIGCQWIKGRWPAKSALDFASVNDRVRLTVSGEFDAVTLAGWVRIQGLDRKFNSLFMCDGFAPGTLHWLIRNDGVLGLTVIGSSRSDYQILVSPPVLRLDQFGAWIHLAVVLDGPSHRAVHYVNGTPVAENSLRINPPFRVGPAELGNWNASGFPGNDPNLIRNFSGAMDEFCLFGRALDPGEVQTLFLAGRPQLDPTGPRK